ncbi:MAG TPA: RagB/SusD family nutrient uptake outer membrane protein [Gemmatimonadaceae bacterium]
MKINSRNRLVTLRSAAAALAALSLGACNLDVTNPNAATEQGVLATVAGIRALAVGMQGRFGNSMEKNTYVPGLVSGELANTSASQSTQREFQNFPTASSNVVITDTNVDLLAIWATNYATVKSADDILDNIGSLTFAPGTSAGIIGLAKLNKAMSYGFLIEAFQKISVDRGATFVDRPAALTEILTLLASAKTDVTGTTLTTDFTGSILSPNFDLLNTIRAMQARYSLAAGSYDAALAFANEVPATATSVITFAGADINTLRDLFHGSKYFGAISTYRTNAEAGDSRVAAFTTATAFAALNGASMFETNIYLTDASPIPVFSQDELSLIRAEALARLNRLPEAIAQINVVRNRAGLPSKAAADLPTQAAVLDEIFAQRTYSLFATGLHWADERRFGKIALAKVAYLPYPFTVRATNPGTPANP